MFITRVISQQRLQLHETGATTLSVINISAGINFGGVFINLKRRDPGVYFRCTFSNVFRIWHDFFTLNISSLQKNLPPKGVSLPKYALDKLAVALGLLVNIA